MFPHPSYAITDQTKPESRATSPHSIIDEGLCFLALTKNFDPFHHFLISASPHEVPQCGNLLFQLHSHISTLCKEDSLPSLICSVLSQETQKRSRNRSVQHLFKRSHKPIHQTQAYLHNTSLSPTFTVSIHPSSHCEYDYDCWDYNYRRLRLLQEHFIIKCRTFRHARSDMSRARNEEQKSY